MAFKISVRELFLVRPLHVLSNHASPCARDLFVAQYLSLNIMSNELVRMCPWRPLWRLSWCLNDRQTASNDQLLHERLQHGFQTSFDLGQRWHPRKLSHYSGGVRASWRPPALVSTGTPVARTRVSWALWLAYQHNRLGREILSPEESVHRCLLTAPGPRGPASSQTTLNSKVKGCESG